MARLDQAFKDNKIKKTDRHSRQETVFLHYTKLIDNKAQYCNEKNKEEIEALADLIDADGKILQNILVRKSDTDEYEIIAGHKRRRAAKLLVEERGKEQYAFLPCTVENLSDVRAEFQVYSSNSHHVKDDYELMHELERMKYLLETYPEEFPHLQTGRMVERLAKQMNLKRTTVGEYLTIANNLGEKGMKGFKNGEIKKSAAVELSSLPEEEQEELIDKGITSHREIKAYKEEKKAQGAPEPKESRQGEVKDTLEAEEIPEPEVALRPEKIPEPDRSMEPQASLSGGEIVNVEEKRDVPKFGTQREEMPDVPDFGMQRNEKEHTSMAGNPREVEPIRASDIPETEKEPGTVDSSLPHFRNDTQRKEWLRNYEAWGVWYRDDNIGAVYYKYDFPDGTRLIAETYPREDKFMGSYTTSYLHLVGGPEERKLNTYGLPLYPYHKHYNKYPDSETELLTFLKAIQKME